MATPKQNSLDAKQDALDLLEQGRAEISAEMLWLRHRMNPKEALTHAMQRHSAAMLAGGFVAGLTITLLLFRRKRLPTVIYSSPLQAASFLPPVRQRSFAGKLAAQAVMTLMPLAVMPALEKIIKRHLVR